MHVLGIVVVLFCCAFPTSLYSAPVPSTAQQFQTSASFSLGVQKSKTLKVGKSRLATKSAFVTYTNEFFEGVTKALKVQFFTQPIMEEARAKLLRGDNHEISRGGSAILVLFLDDDENQIWQANLTYVVPGTTVARTVAASPEELRKYFSDYHFDHNRLQLKSKGSYTAPDSKEETLILSWDTDLDLPVFDQIKK